MVSRVFATQFIRLMTVGRTAPLLCGCEDQNENHAGEYVVKLGGSMDRGVSGLIAELLGSRLASHFGILVPEPAIVHVSQEFAALVAKKNPEKAVAILASVGLNFGSRLIHPVTVWPVNRTIPEAMRQAAVEIFAFDALIQNPDRRVENPNLFTQSDDIFVYDHDLGFSFLLNILPNPQPWNMDAEPYLPNHVFFSRLRSHGVSLAQFKERLLALTDEAVEQLGAEVPEEWPHPDYQRVRGHLCAVRDHADDFIASLERRLA
jgi:hypothetical protein